jgi:hypothetical protein
MKRAFAWTWVFLAPASVPASVVAGRADAAEAPFGFFWSQDRDTLPDPSSVFADENMLVRGGTLFHRELAARAAFDQAGA